MGVKTFLANQLRKPSGWFGRKIAGIFLNKANSTLEDMGLKIMNIQPSSNILEIGFGNGRLISLMGNKLTSGKIVGIEISKEMIAAAKKKNQQLITSGKLTLIEASLDNIPAKDDSFDKVFTANTIYFWPSIDLNMQEIKRTIKPGGLFYCAIRAKSEMLQQSVIRDNQDTFVNLFEKEELKIFLEKSGFINVKVQEEKGKPFTNIIVQGTKK